MDYPPMARYPQRIVCLTEETTETLYLLGQGHRIVGVSGYTVRPPEARQKPKVSAFINARFDKIQALEPDLVLAFSDLQADLAAELVRRGIAVVTFNQRSIAEILQMIRMLGGLVGCQREAETLADRLASDLDRIRESAARFPRATRVFFEEWDDPLISGIRWVEELVEIAGGRPLFPELAGAELAEHDGSAREFDFDSFRQQARGPRIVEEPTDGFASAVAVIECQAIDVHPYEPVRPRPIEPAAELHGVFDRLVPVVEAVRDA